jgi:acyl-CoA thioester hydrolase
MSHKKTETRVAYRHFMPLQTRWADNDLYGHVNNVTYYAYFDTAVNCYLIERGGLDIFQGAVIGVAVETHCNFAKSVAYPDTLEAGLRVGRLGTSSVRYEIGIFRAGEDEAAAHGHFVHVFVERATNKPVPIPPSIRTALEKIAVARE